MENTCSTSTRLQSIRGDSTGMSVEHVINVLKIANSDNVNNTDNDNNLPAIEYRYNTRGKFTAS
jgi:hypothetical protein